MLSDELCRVLVAALYSSEPAAIEVFPPLWILVPSSVVLPDEVLVTLPPARMLPATAVVDLELALDSSRWPPIEPVSEGAAASGTPPPFAWSYVCPAL